MRSLGRFWVIVVLGFTGVLLGLSGVARAQDVFGLGQQNSANYPSSSSAGTEQQSPNQTPTGQGNTSAVPACSTAQPGQTCVKDLGTSGNSNETNGGSTLPVITSGPDEQDGYIVSPGERPQAAPQNTSGNVSANDATQQQSSEMGRQPNQAGPAELGKGESEHRTQMNGPVSRQSVRKSQFQRFVAASIGKQLPVFGQDLFEHVPSTFAPLDQIPVPSDYVIGPGDQLMIRAWGQIDVNYKATVDRNGSIYIPRIGQINVAGVRYSDLQQYMQGQIGKIYRNFQMNVNLGRLRSISIFVVGQAKQPGTYTVSSLSTLVNALFTSGGPSASGSMRHIELKRNDQVVTDFDLYDLLLRGDKSKDVALLAGDVLYIPPVGPQVAIAGSVHNPAIYELRDETTLGQLLAVAGGLSITAEGKHVIVERIDNHKVRHMAQFDLDATGLGRRLQDGDVITVMPLNPRFDNAVVLRGNVAVPGRYPWREGMRISDLIPSREALLTTAYWRNLNGSAEERPSGQEQLRTDIERTAPEINLDYAVVQRLDPATLVSSLLPFNLGQALDGKSNENLVLQPGDVITIFSQADIREPIEKQSKYVRLEGEMTTAGVYKAEAGETLRKLLMRVGGLTPDAYLYGAQLTRESTRIEQQAKLDKIGESFSQDVERSAANKSQNLTNPAEAATLSTKVESQRRLADRLRQIKATGRIVLDTKPSDNSIASLPDITLEDGDRLVVPYQPSTVGVLGAVYDQADFIYRPGLRVADYLRQAGGATKTGDKKRLYIIRANGSVRGMQGSSAFHGSIMGERMYAGDAIVVPEQINKTTLIKNLQDYGQILAQFGLGAAAIKVLAP